MYSMMMLGVIRFTVEGTGYDQLKRTANFSWPSQSVIGKQPVYQYLGHGEKTITLTGTIYPGQYGDRSDLQQMEAQAGLGLPLPLITGNGFALGLWCIKSITQDETLIIDNGDPRHIKFTLELVQYAGLADLATDYLGGMVKDKLLQPALKTAKGLF